MGSVERWREVVLATRVRSRYNARGESKGCQGDDLGEREHGRFVLNRPEQIKSSLRAVLSRSYTSHCFPDVSALVSSYF